MHPAANGDHLLAKFISTGVTAETGTPGWTFTKEGCLVDGGTGRFLHAEGALAVPIIHRKAAGLK